MKTPILYCDDGEEIKLPIRYELCPTCEGKGTSTAYLGTFTGQELREDPDFAEDYLSGVYDRRCDTCVGKRVIEVVDESRCSPEHLEAYREQVRDNDAIDAINRQEIMAEGGWREMEGYW